MEWLFVIGVSFDLTGALVLVWSIFRRTPGEMREEGTFRLNGNIWVVLEREREQKHVRLGVVLLLIGFSLQLSSYLAALTPPWQLALGPLFTTVIVCGGMIVAHRSGSRLRYRERVDLPEGIADQRHAFRVEDKDGVLLFWCEWARVMLGRDLVEGSEAAVAYINTGQWLADCPRCRGGSMSAWPEHDRATCLSCGAIFRVEFPPDRERREIERLLLARPQAEERHWRPPTTISDLVIANAQQGIVEGDD